MITRRSFLSLLACLPFVGRWVPQTEPIIPITLAEPWEKSYTLEDEPIHAPAGSEVFERHLAALIKNPPAHLIEPDPRMTMANIVDEAALRAIAEQFPI